MKEAAQRSDHKEATASAALRLLRRIADEARTSGTFQALTEGSVPHEEIDGLFQK